MNPQVIMDGLIAGATIGLGAVGITLTYSILRFSNFAHGELISWGAYFSLAVAGLLGAAFGALSAPIGPFSFGWALPFAAIVAVALNAALALLVDALLFSRLRAKNSTVIIMVMASFGAALTLRNVLEFIFTGKPRTTPARCRSRCGSAVASARRRTSCCRSRSRCSWWWACTCCSPVPAIGRSMRAVSENPQLAGLAGVNVRQVIRMVWVLGAGLAAVAGVIAGLIIQIRPEMGLDLLLPLFAAAILGGIGSVPGAMAAGLIIGISEAVAVAAAGSSAGISAVRREHELVGGGCGGRGPDAGNALLYRGRSSPDSRP